MKNIKNELGNYIAEARIKKGLSQRELARQTNVDSAEISRLEAGKRKKPNVLYLNSLAEVLDLNISKLMQLAGYNEKETNWFKFPSKKDRSIEDYRNALQDYERFYFDVLEDINNRRKNDNEIKNILVKLIEKIEHPDFYTKDLTQDEILIELKKAFEKVRPNLEKFDKSKYPNYDSSLF